MGGQQKGNDESDGQPKIENINGKASRDFTSYYPKDTTYDKGVYENSPSSYFKIFGALCTFWTFNAVHWWGVFSLGIVDAQALAWYSIGCFVFTLAFLAGLLVSGKFANARMRYHQYLVELTAQLEAEKKERETRA